MTMRLINAFIALAAIVATGCSTKDDPAPLKSPYEQTDPGLRYLLPDYLFHLNFYTTNDVNTSTDDFMWDTTNIVLTYKSSVNTSINLTEIKKVDNITYITFHKQFFQPLEALGYDLKKMYVIKTILKREFECIGPFREFKTEKDIQGFLLMVDRTKWKCTSTVCCPVTYKIEGKAETFYWTDIDILSYWYRNLKGDMSYTNIAHVTFNFSELQSLYSNAGIPICNM
jgi:hypothetical protein